MAFNSKNLQYDKNEPAFLRKLRGEYGNDRQTYQAARPKRNRQANDEDDGPTMVDEAGASVSKEDYEAMINGKNDESESKEVKPETIQADKPKDDEASQETPIEKQKVVDVGAGKKRKQVKVIGEQNEGSDATEEMKEEPAKKSRPTKKPKKKVKLSFDEPEG
jgi:hypothetical protein